MTAFKIVLALLLVAGLTATFLFGWEPGSSRPVHYQVATDLTKGREGQASSDSLFIEHLFDKLTLSDEIEIYAMHSYTEAQVIEVVQYKMPDSRGPFGRVLARARDEVRQIFRTNWRKAVGQVVGTELAEKTDAFGFFRIAAANRSTTLDNVLFALSDMQQVGDGCNFEMEVPNHNTVKLCQRKNLVPDLSDFRLYVSGCTATHGISNGHYRALERWWVDEFFPLTGVKVSSYSSGYKTL